MGLGTHIFVSLSENHQGTHRVPLKTYKEHVSAIE